MLTQPQPRRHYDHRIRKAVVEGRDLVLFENAAIPASTRRTWIRRGAPVVVALHDRDSEIVELAVRVDRLERHVARLLAMVRLLRVLVRAMGARLEAQRLPDGAAKVSLLGAVARASEVLGKRSALRLIGLSDDRFRAWKRRELTCALDDAPPCPRSFPSRLTRDERASVRDLVTAERYRHLSIRSLSLLARRTGRVFASYGTWCALIREHCWRRPRQRVYPAKPKVGVRANGPNEWWHVDVTIIRLLDGSRAYLHGVIDNYSRKVLAWTIEPVLRAEGTRAILLEARSNLANGAKVRLMTDGGSENLIVHTDASLAAFAEHVVAQVEVHFSNSVIEAFWNALRHQWLYLHALDTIDSVRRLVAKYVEDHNALIPRVELGDRTPDEAYAGAELDLRARLTAAHAEARRARAAANRTVTCGTCVTDPSSSSMGP